MIAAIRKTLGRILNAGTFSSTPYNEVPSGRLSHATRYFDFRRKLLECSMDEDELNPFYGNILDAVSKDNLGPFPLVIMNSDVEELNYKVEDQWVRWGCINNVGTVLRKLRRDAAKTGIGIAMRYYNKDLEHPVCYKNICITQCCTPRDAPPDARIFDGIEYDENWDPVAIHVARGLETDRYSVNEDGVLIWWLKQDIKSLQLIPECSAAFLMYPSVRRYFDAVLRGEEFSASIPMSIEVDAKVYKPDAEAIPSGQFKYEPGMVPTLPPGTKLTGVSGAVGAKERTQMLRLMVAAASRVKNYPVNLAMGDSSNSNMATAQIDIQPWKKTIEIERFDFEPILHQVFKEWVAHGVTLPNYLPTTSSSSITRNGISFYYRVLFEHPDPFKNASARATDLLSGAKTLHMVYSEQSLNPRREFDREAKLLNLTREELTKYYLASRSPQILELMNQMSGMNPEE